MSSHPVVSREAWTAARKELLLREKELTRQHDELMQRRRALPWVRVEDSYVFGGPDGKVSLAELFRGRSQLIVYHFMFGPGWKEGCVGCSFVADHVQGCLVHLEQRDVAFAAVSRAPLAEILPFKQRMGWTFNWVSSHDTRFNYDFEVSFTPEQMARKAAPYNYATGEVPSEEMTGTSVFFKDASGAVFHTYSTYSRGCEGVLGTYALLDMLPKGREENGPNRNLGDWVRHHDRYGHGGTVASTGRYVPASAAACGCEK